MIYYMQNKWLISATIELFIHFLRANLSLYKNSSGQFKEDI